MSDIGAIEFGWWHPWHLAWKIGATSLENVTGVSAARTGAAAATINSPAETVVQFMNRFVFIGPTSLRTAVRLPSRDDGPRLNLARTCPGQALLDRCQQKAEGRRRAYNSVAPP